MESDVFFNFVCSELKVVSDEQSRLPELNKDLHASQKYKSLRGQILSIRKILDSHFHLNFSKYDWEDDLPTDINKHCEDKIVKNHVSARTLVFYWNMWKETVVNIFESLGSFQNEESNDLVDFILNFFGVRKRCVKGNIVYLLVNKDVDWIKSVGQKGLHRDGKLVTIDIKELVFAMRSYWQSELLSVGIKVLETLDTLFKSKSNGSPFHQSASLLHIFEVSKFLLDCQYLNLTNSYTKKLQRFPGISMNYFDIVFPLDWRKSMSEDLISLRKTELSVNLLDDITLQSFDIKGDLTYWTIGRVMMISFTDRKPFEVAFSSIIRVLQWHPAWKSFIVKFCCGGLKDAYVARELQYVLEDTFRANWRRAGFISPQSFVYLLDSLLFYASCSSRTIFTSKSSLVGWLTQFHSNDTPSTNLSVSKQKISDDVVRFIVGTAKQILCNKKDTVSWIETSKISPAYYQPLLALKLVMMLSLICLQVPDRSQVLMDLLLGSNNIAHLLPTEFVGHLLNRRNGRYLNLRPYIFAEAFLSLEDPLLIVSSENPSPKIDAPWAIFVDLRKSKEEIMNELFPMKNISKVDVGTTCEPPSSNTVPDNANQNVTEHKGKLPVQMNCKDLKELCELVSGKKRASLLSAADTIKEEIDTYINMLSTVLKDEIFCAGRDASPARSLLSDLKMLSSAFDTSRDKVEQPVFMENMLHVSERLQIIRPTLEDLLIRFLMTREPNVEKIAVSESSSTTEIEETSDDGNTQVKTNNKNRSKKRKSKKK